tara:strand:+ start:18501 stop:19328 length:828 start_codon:yes stop_codon:yes gene_type:complete
MKEKTLQEHWKPLTNWAKANKRVKYIFVIAFTLISAETVVAQEDTLAQQPPKTIIYDHESTVVPPEFDTSILEKYQDDPHFDYTEHVAEENFWQRFKNWLYRGWVNFWTWLFGDFKSNSFLLFLFKIFPYLIIGFIIAFLVWLFYRLNPGAKLFRSEKQAEVFFTAEEEIIKSKNIQDLIDSALQDKNYRLAVRYYFLQALKKLTDAGLINYEYDKTNSDYAREIIKEPLANTFRKITNIYEYIWYGSFEVSESDFLKAQKMFGNMNNQISGPRE